MPSIFDRHKPIRNKLKTLEPTAFLDVALSRLHQFVGAEEDARKWNGQWPWVIMLLVRWALYYSEPALGLKVVNQDDFTTLLNDAYRLSNNGLKLEGQLDENVAPIFIRRLYGFQMPYQVQTYRLRGSSGRQLILFQEMGAAYATLPPGFIRV